MDYEKKLKLAKEALESGSYDKDTIEYIFPELKESEDERIKKGIIYGLKHLERELSWDFVGDVDILDTYDWLEKQGYNADNVEPKFKVGDWVICVLTDSVYQIKNCVENLSTHKYGYDLTNGGYIGSDEVNYYNLWTIQDAKDGDVLNSPTHNLIWIYKDNEHYHACANMNYVTENVATDGLISIPNDACPATKDEQTILFTKMHEAGYEWDTEKKELKKINQLTKQNADN